MHSSTTVTVSQFLLGRGWRFHIHEARRLFDLWEDMRTVPLPDGLHFLHPFLRGAVPMSMMQNALRAARLVGARSTPSNKR